MSLKVSYVYRLTYHVILCTHKGRDLLNDKVRKCLAEFFDTCWKGSPLPMDNMIEGYCITEDQVHLTISGEPETSIAGIIEELKYRTDKLLRKKFKELFTGRVSYIWQAGYSVFTWGTGNEENFRKCLKVLKDEKIPLTISGIN